MIAVSLIFRIPYGDIYRLIRLQIQHTKVSLLMPYRKSSILSPGIKKIISISRDSRVGSTSSLRESIIHCIYLIAEMS